MTHVAWYVVAKLSALMEPQDREAVLGDWAESEAGGGRVLVEMAGLVLRQQVGHWTEWRPWLALSLIALPNGILLGHVAHWWADHNAIYLYLYFGNWTWGYLASPGARSDLISTMATMASQTAALGLWSWTAGAALSMLSGRAWRVAIALFVVVIVTTVSSTTPARDFGGNAAVYSSVFYGDMLPWLFKGGLVLAPSWHGMLCGQRPAPLAVRTAAIAGIAVAGLAMLMSHRLEAPLVFALGAPPATESDGTLSTLVPWLLPGLQLAVMWPAFYLLVAALRERRRVSAVL